jgi:hypothetical protein
MGKRFIFSCIAIICSSVVAIMLNYDAKSFCYIVGILSGVFTAGQTLTDHKKINNNVG